MQFSHQLLSWYHQHQRALPWRETKEPYKIWVSEVILQQTRVQQAIGYYHSFLQAFPDVESLAAACPEKLLRVWQGLGYYTRARNLQQAARYLVDHNRGELPDNYRQWLALKGVGPYTAAAVASICFNEPVAAIDGNVVRVLARYFALENGFVTAADKRIFRDLAHQALDPNRPGDFNQAMMELGATICTPARPQCTSCPLLAHCTAFSRNQVKDYPVKTPKYKPRERYFHYFLFFDPARSSFPVQKRLENDIWKNLFELPLIEAMKAGELHEPENHPVWKTWMNQPSRLRFNGQPMKFTHKLTHQTIFAWFYTAEFLSTEFFPERNNQRWVNLYEFEQLPKSRLLQKFMQQAKLPELKKDRA